MTFNSILDKHAPLQKLTKKELKLKEKPWITRGILKSIQVRDSTYKKLIKAKDDGNKKYLEQKLKTYRNKLTVLIRESKKRYYEEFFLVNKENLHKVWKGIKSIINSKEKNHNMPNCVISDGNYISDTKDICEEFNKYFSGVASQVKKRIVKTNKSFMDFLKNRNLSSMFLNPTSKEEVESTISDLNQNKATGPSSIPTKILKLSKEIISIPLAQIIRVYSFHLPSTNQLNSNNCW